MSSCVGSSGEETGSAISTPAISVVASMGPTLLLVWDVGFVF